MEELNYQNPWKAIPLIPCIGLEETLSFWEMLRFKITYKQLRPYKYGVVERTGIELHFHQLKGISKEVNFYRSLIIVDNT
nr:hypothetical protein [Pedobacter sp. ASV2]